jgi:poly(3-hydroxyalkanoate) synthetase
VDERDDLSMLMLWPWLAAASFGQTAATLALQWTRAGSAESPMAAPEWASPNRVGLELSTLRLRRFDSAGEGLPARLVIAPLALHHATLVDFAAGHSLVEVLLAAAPAPLFVTEWRSASPRMSQFSIATYLAELNVAVDAIGPPVDLVGICQGGWLALVFAARFPGKVRSIVAAGSPIDIRASTSALSELVDRVPAVQFEALVRQGEGRVIGQTVLRLWGAAAPDEAAARSTLQIDAGPEAAALERRFLDWYAYTLDLPGAYYLEVVEEIYRHNRIAAGAFSALGIVIDLANVRAPIFVLAGANDAIVAPPQALAIADLAKRAAKIETRVEPCGHLSLFMGRQTLARAWPGIGRWIASAA